MWTLNIWKIYGYCVNTLLHDISYQLIQVVYTQETLGRSDVQGNLHSVDYADTKRKLCNAGPKRQTRRNFHSASHLDSPWRSQQDPLSPNPTRSFQVGNGSILSCVNAETNDKKRNGWHFCRSEMPIQASRQSVCVQSAFHVAKSSPEVLVPLNASSHAPSRPKAKAAKPHCQRMGGEKPRLIYKTILFRWFHEGSETSWNILKTWSMSLP